MKCDIHGLCSWQPAVTDTTLSRVGLDKLFAKLGIGAQGEELFGEVPATYVHTGNVHHRGPVLCNAQGHGIFIIAGSLAIDGAFTLYTADAYTILVVTHDLSAAHLHQAWDTQLVVLGATTIAGLLCIDVSDAGFALFRGPVTSRDRLIVRTGVAADVPMFAKKPRGKLRGLEELEGGHDPGELHPRLVAGAALFAVTKGIKKPPGNAVLAKMSVAEVLGVTGFEDMQIQDAKINPNWFRKGKPGCALASLSLLAETYVDAFPPTLASLTLLNQADGARTEAMLRVLPRSLTRLRLSGTAITAIPAEALPQLEELELQGNASLASLPAGLGSLPLRRLTVTDNAIAKLPADLDLDRIGEVIFDEPALKLRKQPS